MGNYLIVSLTIASSGPLTLLSLNLAPACNTRSTVISAATFLFKLLISFLLETFDSTFLRSFLFPPGQCVHLFAVSLRFSLPFFSVSVKCPFTYSSVSGFLRVFVFPCSEQHFTRCSALAFLACFPSILLLIFAVHLAAASSRCLTFSGVLVIVFSLCAIVRCATFPAAFSMFLLIASKFSSVHSFLSITFFLNFKDCSSVIGFHAVHFLFPFFFCVCLFLYSCKDRIMIPCRPQPAFVVDVDFSLSSHGPYDVVQLRTFFLLIWA